MASTLTDSGTVGTENGAQETAENPHSYSFEVLHILQDCQQQHGLRHGDFQRYRSYCTRRLRRIRKSLKFMSGNRNKFVHRKITEDNITDMRYLYLPLVSAERAWSFAMQLKQESNTEPRKRFHLHARLRKAVKFAEELETLAQCSKFDARSKLEAQAYCSWMKGTLYFEEERWEDCIKVFGAATTIYEKLASALNEEQRALYLQRVEEISPNIRYCAYNIGDESAINDLVQMRLKSGGQVSSNIDSLLAQTREKQAATLSEVTWRGRTVPVKNEQVRAFLLSCQENEQQIAGMEDNEGRVSIYENLLMECKDALQILRDELKADPTVKQRSQKGEGPVPATQFLHTYLTYIRLTKTIDRNMLMAASLKANLPNTNGVTGATTSTSSGSGNDKKVTKPQDLIRIYDIILQNLAEIPLLPGLEEDVDLVQEVQAKSLQCKAFRCFYLAQSYSANKKWMEASTLFEKVFVHTEAARKEWQSVRTRPKEAALKELEALNQQVNGMKYSAQASSILDSEDFIEEVSNLSITDNNKPVSERLHQYVDNPSSAANKPNLVPFPPEFQPVPCKPFFFDIALNHIEFPSLEDKLEKQNAGGGLTGFLRGWWGGGAKK